MRELYPKVRAAVYSSHSFGHPDRYPRKAFRIVLLNRSTCPYVWGWYVLENTFSIPSSRHNARKNLAANCGPLSVRTCLGGPYVNTQCSQNAFATIYAVVILRGTVPVSLENRSVMTKRNWFPCVVFGSGHSRSIETYSNGEEAGNSFRKLVLFRCLIRFRAHASQFRTVSATSTAVFFQKKRFCNDRNIRVTPGCPTLRGKCSRYRMRGCKAAETTTCIAPSRGARCTRSPAAL
jgi:hypothetical protein